MVMIEMDTPSECRRCRFYYMLRCTATEDKKSVYMALMAEEKPEWCPLIHVRTRKPISKLLLDAGFE